MSRKLENKSKISDRHVETLQSPSIQYVSTFYQSNSSDVGSFIDGLGSITVGQQTIDDAITGFAESVKVGMKVLDELAKLHPFIGAPVLAFKLVISLDMKRRDNNAKVIAIMVQIQDMLTVLFQLRDVKDTKRSGPDGTLEVTGGFTNLMNRIADDIKQCASACDVYLKKSLLRKFLKSPVYESRLADYASKFAAHHENLQLALASLTAVNVDELNNKLDEQQKTFADIQNQFKALFKRLDTPKEREIRKIIDDKGGAGACVEDESVVKELIKKSEDDSFRTSIDKDNEYIRATAKPGLEKQSGSHLTSIKDIQKLLRQELSEDFEKTMRDNFDMFKGKLDIQHNEIKDTIERQGDRIISYFSGEHGRIINPHIRAIWREMGWKGSIKAVNFVFALRDYFLSPLDGLLHDPQDSLPFSPESIGQFSSPGGTYASEPRAIDSLTTNGDEWTKRYINISHLQPILESIDDDGSGFISIREVNRFTLDRPEDWSFLQWLAYWASGWHMSITQYKSKIYRLLRKMFMLLPKARPDNRVMLTDYMETSGILKLECLLRSTKDRKYSTNDSELSAIVEVMNEKQEAHLKQNLESLGYKLDSVSTVHLVCGPGRIDKHVYPLIYVLLQQHIKKIQLARTHILHFDEFNWCCYSLDYIWDAFDQRCNDLKATFNQMQINPEIQFENFAFGMFKASGMKPERQKTTYISEISKLPLDPDEDADVEKCPENIDAKILTYGVQDPVFLPPYGGSFGSVDDIPMETGSLSGNWTGGCVAQEENGSVTWNPDGLLTLFLKQSAENESGVIKGRGHAYMGSFGVSGTYLSENGGILAIEMTLQLDDHIWIECRGTFNNQRSTIFGKCFSRSGAKSKPEDPVLDNFVEERQFIFTKTSAYLLSYCPDSDPSFKVNPSRSRWKFALNAVLYDVQRMSMSKHFVMVALRKIVRLINAGVVSLIKYSDLQDPFIYIRSISHLTGSVRNSDPSFEANPARSRWRFALDTVRYDTKRRMMSKDFVFSSFRKMLRLRNLSIRDSIDYNDLSIKKRSELSAEEKTELSDLERNSPLFISQFTRTIAEFVCQRLPYHYVICNKCNRMVIQSRILCITCRDETFDGLDLCLGCMNRKNPKPYRDYVHEESHSLIRCDYPVHAFQISSIVHHAREVSERIKTAFRSIEDEEDKLVADGLKDNESSKANPTTVNALPITDSISAGVIDGKHEGETDGDSEAESDVESTGLIGVSKKTCTFCKKTISLPCWVFLYEESTCVCDSCDAEKLIPTIPEKVNLNLPHTMVNIMLRITNSKKEISFERNGLVRVEKRLETVKEEMDKRVGQLEDTVLDRTNALEEHLRGIHRAITGSELITDEISLNKIAQSTELQRMEERLSAIESRFSKVEGALGDILAILRDNYDPLNV